MNRVNPPAKNKSQTLKGFRDFLPETMIVRNYVKNLLIEVFESFGFLPLETPSLEYSATLLGKYGPEADKLVYTFQDQGQRQIGLRYDLTVPVSRVLSLYSNKLPLPFKRYQIQPVWRSEKPQKGRYREVLQCDIDTFGSSSPLSDAETIAVIYTVLEKLNFKKYSIRINSRQVLKQIIEKSGIKEQQNSVLQSLDKFQKIGQEGVKNELVGKGLQPGSINRLFEYIKSAQPDEYLQEMFSKIKNFDVPDTAYTFDPTMVRGLDYYTGPIFETYVEEPRIGSITGGGRYDSLVKDLGGPDIPAVGTTIGLDRIVDCIIELNLLPNLPKTKINILVANFDPETETDSLKLANFLRQNNLSVVFYPKADKLGKQIKYALDLAIPYLCIIGPDEIKENKVVIKDLAQNKQSKVSREQLIKILNRQ